jgi:hypothetical protein
VDRAYSQVLESKLRHPLERPLFTAFVALNFALMGLSMFVVMKGSDWLKDHPRLAKHSGRVRTLALAAVFGPPATVLLRNTRRAQIRGNSIRVSPRQFPLLYEILKRHCETLGISRMPELYISDVAIKEPSHAYSSWKRDYIVLGSTFLQPNLEAMRDVFGFLLGRELGRLRLGHANWLKDLLLVYVDKIPYVKNSLLRVFTYSEDRYGAWLAPDSLPGVVAIASGRRMAHEVDIEDYLRQVQEDRSPWGRLSVILSATPQVSYRIQALRDAGLFQNQTSEVQAND